MVVLRDLVDISLVYVKNRNTLENGSLANTTTTKTNLILIDIWIKTPLSESDDAVCGLGLGKWEMRREKVI